MLFETVINTTKNSNNEAIKLIKSILNRQKRPLKQIIDHKTTLYFEEKNGENENLTILKNPVEL